MQILPKVNRLLMLAVVAGLHWIAFCGLGRSTSGGKEQVSQQRLVTIFIAAKIQDYPTSLPTPNLSRITVATPEPLAALNVDQPDVDFEVNRNYGAPVAAPSLKNGGSIDMAPYIKQAALQPGEGATVVLRIQVLETGEVGRIEVDASSGSRRVDQAAVNYVRALHWYAGRTNGVPHPMWIRWGVRLQA